MADQPEPSQQEINGKEYARQVKASLPKQGQKRRAAGSYPNLFHMAAHIKKFKDQNKKIVLKKDALKSLMSVKKRK